MFNSPDIHMSAGPPCCTRFSPSRPGGPGRTPLPVGALGCERGARHDGKSDSCGVNSATGPSFPPRGHSGASLSGGVVACGTFRSSSLQASSFGAPCLRPRRQRLRPKMPGSGMRGFGLFNPWGPVSLSGPRSAVAGRRASRDRRHGNPPRRYDNLYRSSKPGEVRRRGVVSIAKAAGMKYLVFTTRHHDGFSMFDSKLSTTRSLERRSAGT